MHIILLSVAKGGEKIKCRLSIKIIIKPINYSRDDCFCLQRARCFPIYHQYSTKPAMYAICALKIFIYGHNELIKRIAHKYQSAHSAHVKFPANFVFLSAHIFRAGDQRLAQIVRETRSANNLRLMRIIKGAFWSDALTRPNYYFCFCGRAWHKSLFTLTAGRDGQSRSKRLRFYLLIDTCPACSSFSGRSCCVIRKEATVTALYVFDVQISQTRPLCFDAAQSLESKQTTRSAHIL